MSGLLLSTDETSRGRLFGVRLGYGPISAVLVALLAYLGSQLVIGLGIGIYASLRGYSERQIAGLVENSVAWQFAFVLWVEIFTLLIIWCFLKLRHIKWSEIGLGRRPAWRDLGSGVIIFGLYFVVLLVSMSLVGQLIPSIDVEQEQQIGFETAKGFTSLALVFVSLVVLPPIVEEITVRGFLFTGLRNGIGAVSATLLASLLFALAHLQLGSGAPPLWVAAIDTFILSVVLIMLRLRTGALWAGMVVHTVKNGLAFVALFVL